MLFWRRNKRQEDVAAENEENLYPVVHVMNTLKEYEKEMVQKEVDSLWELNEIRGSFDTVLKETESFQERLSDFEQNFMSIEQASGGFAQVKDTVAQSVQQAQDEVTELKSSSMQVADYFSEMEQTFEELKTAVEKIKQCTDKIVSIADQTNILAINASIEAARAGEAGRGFAVVATQIQKLAEESNSSVSRIEDNIQLLVGKITGIVGVMGTVNEALQKQEQNVNRTKDIFDKIHQDVMEITYRETNMQQSVSGMNQAKDNMSNIIIELSESARNNANLSENAAEMTTQMMHGMEGLEILTVDLTELANRLDRNLKSFRLD